MMAAAKETSMDTAAVAVLSGLDVIFSLKEERVFRSRKNVFALLLTMALLCL